LQIVGGRGEAVLAQQAVEAAFHLAEVAVVTHSRRERRGVEPRLFRVEFPGVEVEDRRRLLLARPFREEPARDGFWHLTQPISASEWKMKTHPFDRRDW